MIDVAADLRLRHGRRTLQIRDDDGTLWIRASDPLSLLLVLRMAWRLHRRLPGLRARLAQRGPAVGLALGRLRLCRLVSPRDAAR